jgi:hypothetical protein
MPQTKVTTETLTLRITVSQPEMTRYNLQTFSELLIDVEYLLKAAAFLSADEAMSNDRGNYYPSDGFALSEAERMPRNFSISRLTYESPADIQLIAGIASASATAISLAAWKVVELWEKISGACELHHRANTYESLSKLRSETTDMVRDEIQRVRSMRADARADDELGEQSMKRLGGIFNHAASALEQIQTVEVEEG